jgi:hypothetical protein
MDRKKARTEETMMGFEEEVKWLRNFFMQYPPVLEGDNLGTTFLSTGAVLLMAAMVGTQSAVLIALLTGLPKRFIGLIVHSLDRMEFRRFEGFRDLERKIKLDMNDHKEIEDSLRWALESFWMAADAKLTERILEEERHGQLVSGKRQDWVDEDELQTFLAKPPRRRVRS